LAAGEVAGVAAELAAAAGVAVSVAAALDFFECFFAGVAVASGLGVGVGSAARTKGAAVNRVMRIRGIKERMVVFFKIDGCIWQGFHFAALPTSDQATEG
jgi:hypothetical protein